MVSETNGRTALTSLPSGPSLDFLGLARLMWDPIKVLKSWHQRYGNTFVIKSPTIGTLVCYSRPADVQEVLMADSSSVLGGEANYMFRPLLGDESVVLLDGQRHDRLRRMLLPPFHGHRMYACGDIIRELTLKAIEAWPRDRRINLTREFRNITLSAILRAVFGVDPGAGFDRLRETFARFRVLNWTLIGTFSILQRRYLGFGPYASLMRDLQNANSLIRDHIEDRRRDRRDASRPDVLSMLLDTRSEDGEAMDDEEIRNALLTLLTQGHASTAIALSWAIELLLRNPRVLQILIAEIDGVTAGGSTWAEQIVRSPYLDSVVKEVLRMHPVALGIVRRTRTPVTIGGFALPPGVGIMIWSDLTHSLPEIYPDPDDFRPERFLDRKPNPYAWIPFGGGTRRCIGMAFAMFEMKIVLATVLSILELRLSRRGPSRGVMLGVHIVPRGGTKVVAHERSSRR